jgi:predicted DNA-binding WGR domain protein
MPGSKGAAWLLDVRMENAPAGAMMIPIRLERREPARNWLRFYTIAVTRTLFDGWAVVRAWGRIGQPGTVRETWFDTESAAIEAGGASAEGKARVSGGGLAFAWVRRFVHSKWSRSARLLGTDRAERSNTGMG